MINMANLFVPRSGHRFPDAAVPSQGADPSQLTSIKVMPVITSMVVCCEGSALCEGTAVSAKVTCNGGHCFGRAGGLFLLCPHTHC